MADDPEPEVLRAAMGGDLRAFTAIVRAYQAPVWRFLRGLLGDDHLAEDVAQETFLRLHQRLPSFGHRSSFSTWVFQVARNAGIDALRRSAVRRSAADRLAARRVASPAPPETTALVRAALGSLPLELREAMLVVEVLGCTYREAGEMLGIPEGTVKSRVHRARRLLLDWLEPAEEPVGEM